MNLKRTALIPGLLLISGLAGFGATAGNLVLWYAQPATKSILGSRTQVLWHSGHFDGLVIFSPENSKPQARQRAGSITALYSACLRLRNK